MKNPVFNERTILGVSSVSAMTGVLGNVIWWAFLEGEPNLGYNALLFTIGVCAIVCYWLVGRLVQGDALTVHAWISGSAFGAMILIDCARGEGWRHLFWLYEFGVFSLVFLASTRRGLFFSIASGLLGLVASLVCGESVVSSGGYMIRPLAFWIASSAVKGEFDKVMSCVKAYLDAKEARRKRA